MFTSEPIKICTNTSVNKSANRKGGRFSKKKYLKAEDLLLYWKTWQVCVGSVSGVAKT